MKYLLPAFLFILTSEIAGAQTAPFGVYLEPIHVVGFTGIQSFAHAQHQGEWLILGGRNEGLHRRQPWASFASEGRNTYITVIDPENGMQWTSPLTSLPLPLQDQMSSTNMEFYQEGNHLYLVGGYGYSQVIDSKLTFALLTAVDVSGVIDAVKKGKDLSPYFRQVTDLKFAVTGGQLKNINNTYYLIGGHKFDGDYNPMNMPTFTQEYTNAIRKFRLNDDGETLTITHLSEVRDTAAFHRRDYNVVPHIFNNYQEGLIAFSGVFKVDADLPYLNCVLIDSSGYIIDNQFAQYFNHYHCAHLPLYASSSREMHTLFLEVYLSITN